MALDQPREGGGLPLPPYGSQSAAERSGVGQSHAGLLSAAWREARDEAGRSRGGAVVAFDEIQKLPDWQGTVKGLWDADRREGVGLHVVLLGSSPLLVHQGLTESLAGRFETIRLSHWPYEEMAEAFGFDLPSYIYFGGS